MEWQARIRSEIKKGLAWLGGRDKTGLFNTSRISNYPKNIRGTFSSKLEDDHPYGVLSLNGNPFYESYDKVEKYRAELIDEEADYERDQSNYYDEKDEDEIYEN
jgi:hypothetical protein